MASNAAVPVLGWPYAKRLWSSMAARSGLTARWAQEASSGSAFREPPADRVSTPESYVLRCCFSYAEACTAVCRARPISLSNYRRLPGLQHSTGLQFWDLRLWWKYWGENLQLIEGLSANVTGLLRN